MRRSQSETLESARRISRRALLLGSAQLAFGGVLAMRMRYLQVDQAEEFQLLAEENRISLRLLPPARGRIFDRNGTVIAENEQTYKITLVPEDAEDVNEVIGKLSQLVELDEGDLNKAMEAMKENASFLPVTLADRVSWNAVSRVSANLPALPGISAEVGQSRIYPQKDLFVHVAGYVADVRPQNLKRYEDPPAVLSIPDFQFGQIGVESKYEDALRGNAGVKQVEVNARGRIIRELDRREGEAGADIQLTVDSALQDYVLARLGDESASVVVMDLEKGDLLAIASAPSFDANSFVHGISTTNYNALLNNDHRPLASKTVQDAYPPGSTFKMVTILAALEAGIVTPEDTYYCSGKLEVGSRDFGCWKRSGHGHVNLEQSLRESCDVYFYELALKVGIEKIAEMGRKLGLGSRPDVPMSAVTSGLMPDKDWKLRERKAEWVIGDSVNASIGQGFVLTSPLQLAVMMSRIATGRSVSPRLIKSIDGVETPSLGGVDLAIPQEHLNLVRAGMFAVSNDRRGTAYRSRIIGDGMRMAGKTGTAQVSSNRVNNDEVPWAQRDHALFVNFAPYDAPQIAVSVVVEHGGGGSKAAAPIARDVTLQALYKGDPPLEAYPTKDRRRIEAQQERLNRERAERANSRGSQA